MTSRRMLFVFGCVFVVAGMVLIVLGGMARSRATPPAMLPEATNAAPPTPTPEPLVPTRTPVSSPTGPATPVPATRTSIAPTATVLATMTASPLPTQPPTVAPTIAPATATPAVTLTPAPVTPSASPVPVGLSVPSHERFRLGVSLPGGAKQVYDLRALGVGWVMDWGVRAETALPSGVDYMLTVRMMGGVLKPDAARLTAVAAARPGSTWLISNEADVRWQDNVDPVTYARLYHEAYTAIKAGDPSAVVAAGGIAQPTALRLRYLDLALESYQAQFGQMLPAQAWHIHNYMLREERDSWGVDIPPGIADNTGVLYSIDDSGNLAAFRTQIWDFRRWMASRGYGGQPLLVSEFGVPMPPDYGFPHERMASFLEETWRFFLTAADPALGDPNDGGRLVQRWCWFSLGDAFYPTGNLLVPATGEWTPLGRVWISLVGD